MTKCLLQSIPHLEKPDQEKSDGLPKLNPRIYLKIIIRKPGDSMVRIKALFGRSIELVIADMDLALCTF